jgi:hypothetical protein
VICTETDYFNRYWRHRQADARRRASLEHDEGRAETEAVAA